METGETQGTGTKQRPAFEEEFKQLPLEEKLGSLFRMEVAAIEETVSVVADASVKVFNKAAEVLDEFGNKVSAEFRKERDVTAEAGESHEAKTKGGKKKSSKTDTEPEVNV
jgi:hypothetical protein